jgi:hypothetical protein
MTTVRAICPVSAMAEAEDYRVKKGKVPSLYGG